MQLEGREETVEKTGQSEHVQCVAFLMMNKIMAMLRISQEVVVVVVMMTKTTNETTLQMTTTSGRVTLYLP